ncbi:HDOD domain-containing protein [Neptunomonas phycophila]|uniref:HDOD domain-containing protein n=1 Tax=Neptunomonas phycophila TaxID=1572645 RepID=UPI0026E38190|nr:HDOD domain-containing protein [Neptunomonas phycophila]MDO6785338.1 HDOD domain-containing protein [Neptunomonas phycophila]
MEQQEKSGDFQTKSDELFGPEAWISFLKDKPFPVRASSLKRLRLLVQNDNTMISQLTALIKSDPILSLIFVRAAQQAHQAAKRDSVITSVEHAVSSLGMDPIEQLANRLKPVKVSPNSIQQQLYFRAIANSHLAAFHAERWMRRKNQPFVDETFLASLFYGVGLWSLWLHAPLHMHEVHILINEKGSDPVAAEKKILGCTMQDISHGLSTEWGFSDVICQAQDPNTSPSRALLAKFRERTVGNSEISDDDNRAIGHMLQDRSFIIKLANWYAMNVSREWQTSRPADTTETVCCYLGGDHDETRTMLNQITISSSHHYHVAGTLAPAAEMLLIASDNMGNYKLFNKELSALINTAPAVKKPAAKKPRLAAKAVTAPSAPTQPATRYRAHPTSPDELLDNSKFKIIMDRFRDGYHLYTKPSHILGGLLQGLSQGLGLQRVTLSLVNTKNQTVKAAQAIGMEKSDPLASYEIDISTGGLFKKLSEKPVCVWIKQSNRAQYERLMSKAYTQILPHQDILIMSIFKDDKPVAVIYADGGDNPSALTDFQHQQFRLLCSAASKALHAL